LSFIGALKPWLYQSCPQIYHLVVPLAIPSWHHYTKAPTVSAPEVGAITVQP
jgi:hypothetical protein